MSFLGLDNKGGGRRQEEMISCLLQMSGGPFVTDGRFESERHLFITLIPERFSCVLEAWFYCDNHPESRMCFFFFF